MPFETALDMEMGELIAWTIAIGEAQGGDFDYTSMRWLKPPEKDVP